MFIVGCVAYVSGAGTFCQTVIATTAEGRHQRIRFSVVHRRSDGSPASVLELGQWLWKLH